MKCYFCQIQTPSTSRKLISSNRLEANFCEILFSNPAIKSEQSDIILLGVFLFGNAFYCKSPSVPQPTVP